VPLRILTLTRRILRLRCAPLRMTSWIALASAQADDRAPQALALLFPYPSFSPAATHLHKEARPARPNLRQLGTAVRHSLACAGHRRSSRGREVAGFGQARRRGVLPLR